MEFVWELVKYLICEQIDLLIGRHLDHLIICSIYAVSKKCSCSIEGFVHKNFDDILKMWAAALPSYNNLEFTKRDINEHNISDGSGKLLGLKDYYNHVYLEKARHYITNFDLAEMNHPTPIKHQKAGILQRMQMDSPLRLSICSMSKKSDFAVYLSDQAEMQIPNSFSIRTPPLLTPNHKMLYASESPFIGKRLPQVNKYFVLIRRPNYGKLINFEEIARGADSSGDTLNDESSRGAQHKTGFNFLASLHSIQQSFHKEGLFSKPTVSFYEAQQGKYNVPEKPLDDDGPEDSESSKTPEFR